MLNYAVAPFQLLDLKRSLRAWYAMDFYGHVIIGVTLVFFLNGGKGIARRELVKRGIDPNARPAKPTVTNGNGPLKTNGNGKGKSGSDSEPVTPGPLGAPHGFSFVVPNVDQGVKEAQAAIDAKRK